MHAVEMRAVEAVGLGAQADARHVLGAVRGRTGAGEVRLRLVREQRDQWPGNGLADRPALYGHEACPQCSSCSSRVLSAGLSGGRGCGGGRCGDGGTVVGGLLVGDGEGLRERLVHEDERHEAREATTDAGAPEITYVLASYGKFVPYFHITFI